MKKLGLALFAILASATLLFAAAPLSYAAAGDVFDDACKSSNNNPAVCGGSGSGVFSIIKTVIQVLLMVGGIVAVIMIIIGGIRYVTSAGDQTDVKAAKDTILYAVIGLAVTMMAYAIVTWVISNVK